MVMTERMFTLYGEITHPGKVTVLAKSLDQAIEKAENLDGGDFLICEEGSHNLLFQWDGNEEIIEEATE